MENILQDAIKNLGWERASKTEKAIKALIRIGINPKNCWFDEKDNLIIPVSEINKEIIYCDCGGIWREDLGVCEDCR